VRDFKTPSARQPPKRFRNRLVKKGPAGRRGQGVMSAGGRVREESARARPQIASVELVP
jgi:hypothetical protein